MAIESLEQLEKTIKLRVELKGTPEEPSPQVEWKLGAGEWGVVRVTKNIPLSVVESGLLMSHVCHGSPARQ